MTDSQKIDLEAQARVVEDLLTNVTDDQLTSPTPCGRIPVGALLDHFMGLTLAFAHAAVKTPLPVAGPGTPSLADLDPDPASVEVSLGLLAQQASDEGTPGLYGPRVPVADDAPPIDRAVGLSGRDPQWRP